MPHGRKAHKRKQQRDPMASLMSSASSSSSPLTSSTRAAQQPPHSASQSLMSSTPATETNEIHPGLVPVSVQPSPFNITTHHPEKEAKYCTCSHPAPDHDHDHETDASNSPIENPTENMETFEEGDSFPEWQYIVIKMKRLEIEVRRLLEMYKKKQRENEILQFQVSCLIGNAKVEDFYKVFPPIFDVASLYQTPESLGKDLDQLMATYEDPEAGNKEERQALFEHAVKALRRDRANQAAARLVLAAVKAEVEGVEIGQSDVEAVLLGMVDLSLKAPKKEDGEGAEGSTLTQEATFLIAFAHRPDGFVHGHG